MNKAIPLLLLALVVGCAAPGKKVKSDLREIPGYTYQEKIRVEGPYTPDDVEKIIQLVGGSDRKVLSIKPTAENAHKYQIREISEFPADEAEVRTGYNDGPDEGWGISYRVNKRNGKWQIVDTNPWYS